MDAISLPASMWELVGRLVLATALGAAIGLNRERQGKPAGLRTHALVALGGSLLATVGMLLSVTDVSATARVLQGVVAGIGFIGAGVILHRGDTKGVHGLTTAAAVWVAGAVGIATGVGLWRTGLTALVLALLVLTVGEAVDRWVHQQPPEDQG